MKKHFLFLLSLTLGGLSLLAQPPIEERIPDRMAVFIGKRMVLNEKEMEQFRPVFARYHQEWRETLKKYREDRLLMQQQVIELQLRYRKEFAPIVGERQVIRIYDLQQNFIRILRDIQHDRMQFERRNEENIRDKRMQELQRLRNSENRDMKFKDSLLRDRKRNQKLGPPPPPPPPPPYRGHDEEYYIETKRTIDSAKYLRGMTNVMIK